MRIAFITNSLLSLESIVFLKEKGVLHIIATLEKNVLLSQQADLIAQQSEMKHVFLHKEQLASELTALIDLEQIDTVFVQTFPYKIPASCLNLPDTEFYNLHPGPLPEYRGPDPVFWALKNNEQQSALTLHKMDQDFDTGPIIMSEPIPVYESDTYGTLNSHMAHAAPVLLKKFLHALENSEPIQYSIQTSEKACYHKKPEANDLLIDWTRQSSQEIQALCRASNPNQNGSIAFFRGVITRILEVDVITPSFDANLQPGTIITCDENRGLQVKCLDNKVLLLKILHVEEGYFSGKRFINVFNVKIGEKFTHPSFLS